MKTKTIFKYFALFLALTIMSCGGSDDSGNGDGNGNGNGNGNSNTVTGVTATGTVGNNTSTVGDDVTLFVGESAGFTVTDNLGNDVTGNAVVTINGQTVSNPYQFDAEGTYVVTITYTDSNGNEFTTTVTVIVSPVPVPTAITLTTSADTCNLNGVITFTVMDDLNNDVSTLATYTVDGAAATNPSQFDTAGDYTIEAKFTLPDGSVLTSNTKSLTVNPWFTTKVLVEDYTGTWCGYCPRLAFKLDYLAEHYPAVIPVGVHNDTPFGFSQVSTMENTFGVGGYPTGKINRTIDWNETQNQVLGYTNDVKPCGLAINSTLTGSSLAITTRVRYTENVTAAHRLVVYVLEDDRNYDQANYMNNDSSSPWYQAGNPIPNFEHDNVLRAALTNILGDSVPSGQTTLGNVYSVNHNYTVPSGYVADNLEVVAFIVDSNNTVVNAQLAQINTDQDFD